MSFKSTREIRFYFSILKVEKIVFCRVKLRHLNVQDQPRINQGGNLSLKGRDIDVT